MLLIIYFVVIVGISSAFKPGEARFWRQRHSQLVLSSQADTGGEFEDPQQPQLPSRRVKIAARRVILTAMALPLRSLAEGMADNPMDDNQQQESLLNSPEMRKGLVNVPSDDFWYPPYMIGTWDTSFKFLGANFSSKLPLDKLSEGDHVPGFGKYSVIFLPDMGKDVSNVRMRYVQVDSHVREDHPHNLRSLVAAFCPGTTVDSAPYSFQKAPNWLTAPANRWHIDFHDGDGPGQVDIFTRKRDIKTDAGTVVTKEFLQQTLRRSTMPSGGRARKSVGEYALVWRISVPASSRDEFVTTENLRKTNALIGTLDVYSYLSPMDVLYSQEPKYPVAVYSYAVEMKRSEDDAASLANTVYPFVPSSAGPVELDRFFGH